MGGTEGKAKKKRIKVRKRGGRKETKEGERQ
jgi:hypothetical protein